MTCEACRTLLSEGLDLCVRARQMDSMDRREATLAASKCRDKWEGGGLFEEYVEQHNASFDNVHRPISTRSGTVPLWLNDQYERDLLDWETRSRKHLLEHLQSERPITGV